MTIPIPIFERLFIDEEEDRLNTKKRKYQFELEEFLNRVNGGKPIQKSTPDYTLSLHHIVTCKIKERKSSTVEIKGFYGITQSKKC